MSTFETDFSTTTFLPLGDEPVSAEDELALVDADILALGNEAVVQEDPPPPLGRGWAFDFGGGTGFRSGKGQGPQLTYGIDTLRVWCEKALRTDRGAHPIHPDDYGMDNPYGAIGMFHDEDPDLEQRVVDALTFHPRITAVRDIVRSYDADDEYLSLSFTIVLDDGSEAVFTDVGV